MRVYSTGFVTARVTVPHSRELDELIPHELEHVVEHIEGIDVRRDAAQVRHRRLRRGPRPHRDRPRHAGGPPGQSMSSNAGDRAAVALLTRR